MAESLLIVAIKTDQRDIARRLKVILAVAEPQELRDPPETSPCAWAKTLDELTAADLDALAGLIGWDAVGRLNLGRDVVVAP